MSWQKIEDMPCVVAAIAKAEKEIKEITGIEIMLSIEYIQIQEDDVKPVLQDIITKYYHTTWENVQTKTRSNQDSVLNARHVYMYLAHKVFGRTQKQTGRDCGMDHTTVINAVKKIEGFYKVGDALVNDIEAIKKLLPRKLTK